MKTALLAGAVLASACATRAARDDGADAALSLANAERAFAAQSVRENPRAAFLAHFASDGVLVRDGWVAARPALEAQPVGAWVLDWHPAYVEVARSGDLGLSTGPWTLTPHDPARRAAHGQFVSVWRREGGQWKVQADIGIAHPQPPSDEAALVTHMAADSRCPQPSGLDRPEEAFAAIAGREGPASALRELGARDVRIYRDGTVAATSPDSAPGSARAESHGVRYTVQGERVAGSGELGFAYGSYAGVANRAQGAWLRVWRCEAQGWRVALDVANATR